MMTSNDTLMTLNETNNQYDGNVLNYYYNEQEDQDCEMTEEDYLTYYDNQVSDMIAEADYQDYYYQQQEEEVEEEVEVEEYDYTKDSLLSLIVGVQSYLIEQDHKTDSPLHHLQYKMYTYMRQRAYELGVQF